MKTTAFVRKDATEQELRAMNAEQIRKDVLSGMPQNTLEMQRAARQQKSVVGKLDTTNAPDVKEALADFSELYPQVIASDSPDGIANGHVIAKWLMSRGAAFTTANFIACLNDVFENLVFDAARIGLFKYGHRITGKVAVRSMPSREFDVLLKPFSDAPKTEGELSAKEYRDRHREDFVDPAVANAEATYVAEEVNKFMQMAPEYLPTPTNRKMLLDAITASGLRINQASLLHVFRQLVSARRMKINESVDVTTGSTRRVISQARLPQPQGAFSGGAGTS
jgi:hypothetical protein